MRRVITALRLDCDSERDALRKLYESNGFELVREGSHIGYKTAWYLKQLALEGALAGPPLAPSNAPERKAARVVQTEHG